MIRWVLAVAALVALAFSNGAFAHPLAAWIGPLLMVRLVRTAIGRRDLLLAWLVYLAAWLVGWSGVFRLGPAGLAPMALVLSSLGFLPYALDRWLASRLAALPASLALPSAAVAVEAGLGLLSPFGAWGALGYSQVELLPLAQLAALTGVQGLSFLPYWFAAVANAVWEQPAAPQRWRACALAFGLLLGGTFGYGAIRLAAGAPTPRLAAAMILPPVQDNRNYDEHLAAGIARVQLAASEAAARGGARLVVWPEDSLFIRGAGEGRLLAAASALAARHRIRFGLAYGLRTGATGLAYRNRFVLIGPDGGIVWRYDKAHPVPGYEARYMQPGAAMIARAGTAAGPFAGAICFDGDHDPVLRAAAGATVLILPSDDWPAIRTLHARMARLRALAIGTPLLRPTINGISVAGDGRGRRLAWADSRRADGRSVRVDLPLDAEPTLFAARPMLFPAASALLLLLLLAGGLLRARAYASGAASSPSSPEPACASAK